MQPCAGLWPTRGLSTKQWSDEGCRQHRNEGDEHDATPESGSHQLVISGTGSMISPRVTRSRGRSWRWRVTRTFSLRTRYMVAARTASPVVILPIRMVQRGPQAEPIHPMNGEPRGCLLYTSDAADE